MTTLLVFLLVWCGTGAAMAFAMRRRGHNLLPWLGLGLAFGPIAIALAVDAAHAEGRDAPQVVSSPGAIGAGTTDVLVACDGSSQSVAALHRAVDILGEGVHRLTLATVVDYDAAGGGPSWASENEQARRHLDEAEAEIEAHVTEKVILNGRPADALLAYATGNGYDLLVAGARGSGFSKAVLGSVASTLARATAVPVLLVADDPDTTEARRS